MWTRVRSFAQDSRVPKHTRSLRGHLGEGVFWTTLRFEEPYLSGVLEGIKEGL